MMSQQTNRQRVSLNKLVNSLVDKWSLEFVDKAKAGDFEAMLTVATIQYSKNGWGKISHNPYQGRRWVEFAASKGDPYAIFTLKNLIMADEIRTDQLAQLRRYAINHTEHPRQWRNIWDFHPLYYKGFNPRRHMGADGQPNQPAKSHLKVFDDDPDAREKTAKGTYDESIRFRNGRPLATHRFPAVYSKNELFRTIKSTLDGKMQHRPTDPLPRPVGEYIHSMLPNMGEHTPLVDYVAGFSETPNLQVVGPEGSFKDHKVILDDDGIPLRGVDADRIANAMDRLDRFNIISSPKAADPVVDEWAKFYENMGFTKIAPSDDVQIIADRAAAHKAQLELEATEKGHLPALRLPVYTADAEVSVVKEKQDALRQYMEEWKKFYISPDVKIGLNRVPELVDEFFLTDGPWQNKHLTWNNFSDVERAMSDQEELPIVDADRTFHVAIGLLNNSAHRYPYMGSPTKNYFEGNPDKIYMHNTYASALTGPEQPGWRTMEALEQTHSADTDLPPADLRRLVRLKRMLDFNIPLGMMPILEHVNETRVMSAISHAIQSEYAKKNINTRTDEEKNAAKQAITVDTQRLTRDYIPVMEGSKMQLEGASETVDGIPPSDNYASMFRTLDMSDFYQHLNSHVDTQSSKVQSFHDVAQATEEYYQDLHDSGYDTSRPNDEKEGRILYPNHDFAHAVRTRGDLVRLFQSMKAANPALYEGVRKLARRTDLPLDEETTLYKSLLKDVEASVDDIVSQRLYMDQANAYHQKQMDKFVLAEDEL